MTDSVYKALSSRYEEGMRYCRCGKSGVLLPEVSLGFWHNFGSSDSFDNARSIVHYAFDQGITHLDLANNYGPTNGAAEELFGQLVKKSLKPYRDELFIATKAGYEMWPGPYGNWGSRKSLMASIDQSLKRMNLDYVDLFYSHRYDPDTPLDETLQALVDIVRQGKALYIGLSRWPKEALAYAFDYTSKQHVPCLIYQGRLSMFDQAVAQEGLLSEIEKKGVGFIAFSPLAQGLLTDRYLKGVPQGSRMTREHFLKTDVLTPQVLCRIERLNALAQSRGETLAQMALKWVLCHSGVTSVLVGASSKEQLASSLKCMSCSHFTQQEMMDINSILAV